VQAPPTVHQLIAELSGCDWVLVEGFKHAALPKIEVWRAAAEKPVQYATDPFVIALATDSRDRLPAPTNLPVLDLNHVDEIAEFILGSSRRCEYLAPAVDAGRIGSARS
jgi:molybdopterin-guanine dinucleotide biosynthesis protein B